MFPSLGMIRTVINSRLKHNTTPRQCCDWFHNFVEWRHSFLDYTAFLTRNETTRNKARNSKKWIWTFGLLANVRVESWSLAHGDLLDRPSEPKNNRESSLSLQKINIKNFSSQEKSLRTIEEIQQDRNSKANSTLQKRPLQTHYNEIVYFVNNQTSTNQWNGLQNTWDLTWIVLKTAKNKKTFSY
jgi:hypothetical protein